MQEDDQELHAAAYRRIWERMRDDDPQAKLYVQDLRDLFMVFGMHPPQPGEEPVIPVWVQGEGPITAGESLGTLAPESADDCRHAMGAVARVGQRLDEVIAAADKTGTTPFVNARQIRDLMDPEGAWSYSFYAPPPAQDEPGGDQTLLDKRPPGSGPPP